LVPVSTSGGETGRATAAGEELTGGGGGGGVLAGRLDVSGRLDKMVRESRGTEEGQKSN
jgi:hypothetical protein